MSIFGAAVLVLAGISVQGLMAYSVPERTQEIGIRAALGAEASDTRMAALRGMTFSLISVVSGGAAVFGLAQLMAAFLFGVQPWDPAVFVAVPVPLTLIAFAAVLIPAVWAATRIDPMTALRQE